MPLITAPYLARKLGSEQLGIFSYTSSVVAYFSLFAMLGTVSYGTRSIASVSNNREQRNITFSNVYTLQIITSLIAIVAYCAYFCIFSSDNKSIVILQCLTLVGSMTDINWLFWGLEKFEITVKRNIIIKLLTVLLILLLVKKVEDLWLYTLIMLGGTVISNFVLFIYLPKYIKIRKPNWTQLSKIIKPNLLLFIPLFAMSVYHIMDKTMLGALSDYSQSGYYYNADKIVQIPLVVINGVGTVMLPRMSVLFASGERKRANELFSITLDGVAAVSIAMAFGIAAISNEFIPIFLGKDFEPCKLLTIAFSPILVIKGFSTIVRVQYLVPLKKEKFITYSVIAGAIVNFVLNIALIKNYGALGATIATVVSETVACISQFFMIKKADLKIASLLKKIIIYLAMGICMYLTVRAISKTEIPSIGKLLVEILVGIIVYSLFCLLYWKKSGNIILKYLMRKT